MQPNTWEAKAEGLMQVPGQSSPHRELQTFQNYRLRPCFNKTKTVQTFKNVFYFSLSFSFSSFIVIL